MQNFQFHFKDLKDQDDEQLIALLSDAATGFEQKDNELFAYTHDENVCREILSAFPFNFTVSVIEEKNWNQQWESSFEPVTINARDKTYVHIRAAFHPPFAEAEQEIIITPKMSFGTGHHATTSMVVKNMKDIDFENKTVIDFGTGTGILAILAERSGASSILAIDNDEWSINNATENITVNNCSKIQLMLAEEIICTEPVDILIANINLNIILAHLQHMKNYLKPHGTLLLSGMLTEDAPKITEALRSFNFSEISVEDQKNWICVKAIRYAQP